MHEMGIAQEILKLALNSAQERHAAQIRSINIKIGEFTAIEPECISFYLGLLAKDTLAQDASIRIETLPLKLKCQDCQTDSIPAPPYEFSCPACGGQNLDILQGQELYLESIEIN